MFMMKELSGDRFYLNGDEQGTQIVISGIQSIATK